MAELTKKYIMAYFDILGYKDIVLNNKISEEKFIAIIYRTIENLKKSKDFQSGLEVKTYFFSDNFVICYEKMDDIEYVNEIRLLIFTIQIIQRDLFLNFGVLIRGAILDGELYLSENFIYGKGLIEAYNIENNEAIYPRIVISKKLVKNIFFMIEEIFSEENYTPIEKLSETNMFGLFRHWMANILLEDDIISEEEYSSVKSEWENINICKDYDGHYFVDFMHSVEADRKSINNVLEKYRNKVILGIQENKENKKVVNKYLWCVSYGNYYFNRWGYKEILHKNEIEEIVGCKINSIDGLLKID